jgi:hypothetical protein
VGLARRRPTDTGRGHRLDNRPWRAGRRIREVGCSADVSAWVQRTLPSNSSPWVLDARDGVDIRRCVEIDGRMCLDEREILRTISASEHIRQRTSSCFWGSSICSLQGTLSLPTLELVLYRRHVMPLPGARGRNLLKSAISCYL